MKGKQTRLVRAGHKRDQETGATAVPIYQSAGFAQKDPQVLSDIFQGRSYGYAYSRIANPTVVTLENHINALNDTRGVVATSSGMAALSIIVDALIRPGDHIISSKSIFGGTYYLFKELQNYQDINITFCETTNIAAYEQAITKKTKGIFIESIGNPKCDVPDLKALCQMAHRYRIPVIVDATVATPYLSNCKEIGIDITWHSATKWISGTGTTLAGLIIDNDIARWNETDQPILTESIAKFGSNCFVARCKKLRSNKGATLSAMSAFMINQGLESLGVRMDRHCENAMKVALFLKKHKEIKSINYPGIQTHPDHDVATDLYHGKYGALLSCRLGSKQRAYDFMRKITLADNLANLGDAKTLMIHPESTIYRDLNEKEKQEAGVFEDQVRFSIGIEDPDDLINDFDQALKGLKE